MSVLEPPDPSMDCIREEWQPFVTFPFKVEYRRVWQYYWCCTPLVDRAYTDLQHALYAAGLTVRWRRQELPWGVMEEEFRP